MNPTNIEWADFVWNPITGCTRVSSGCDNCYAHEMAKRLKGMGQAKYQRPFSQVVCHEDELDAPMKRKKPARIFVCSMSDMFHDDVPTTFIDRILETIAACPQHRFLVLTKRPENIGLKLSEYPPNLGIGVSVENQEMADRRIPILLDPLFSIAMRFISIEPMLDYVRLDDVWLDELDFVIVGGETGHKYRPMNTEWARDVRGRCAAVDVPFFFKHMAGREETPPDLQIRQFPTATEFERIEK